MAESCSIENNSSDAANESSSFEHLSPVQLAEICTRLVLVNLDESPVGEEIDTAIARRLENDPGGMKAYIEALISHPDPGVRRAGFDTFICCAPAVDEASRELWSAYLADAHLDIAMSGLAALRERLDMRETKYSVEVVLGLLNEMLAVDERIRLQP